MSVLSVICLAGLRKAEMESQQGFIPEETESICAECGSEEADEAKSNLCQS